MLVLCELLPGVVCSDLRYTCGADLYNAPTVRSDDSAAGCARSCRPAYRHKGIAPVLRHRAMRLMLILVGSVFAICLHLLAPWYLDRMVFLLHPLLFAAFPLLAVGCALSIRPPTHWPALISWLRLVGFGISGFC